MPAHSIHHVTAVTAQIGRNREFYTDVLGLRLVKKSVNQDDVSAYHLFYADAVGSPGTDMTFFDWPQASQNVPGGGSVGLTTFRVPTQSLDFWESRLASASTNLVRKDAVLEFADFEGQRLALEGYDGPGGSQSPWTQSVPTDYAIRGILGVDLDCVRPERTSVVLKLVFGYEEAGDRTFIAQDGEHFGRVVLRSAPTFGQIGAGGVHHVAFRVANDDELAEVMERAESIGLKTSGYVDRFYFHSVYFREPGGILFELATDGPGFASDEKVEDLGERLALPPFLEERRAEIEANLKPI